MMRLSIWRFSRKFRSVAGITFCQARVRAKIHSAKQLLKTNNREISEFLLFLALAPTCTNPPRKYRTLQQQLGSGSAFHIRIRIPDPNLQLWIRNEPLDEHVDFFLDSGTGLIVRTETSVRSDMDFHFRMPNCKRPKGHL
jgi:hypothetical protein